MTPRALSAVLALGLAGSSALAQPSKSYERDRRGPPDKAASDFEVRGLAPRAGTTGTEVTIRGARLPAGALIQVGKQRVRPTATGPGRIAFRIPPNVRPGKRRVAVVIGGKARPVGSIQIRAERGKRRAPIRRPAAIRPDPDAKRRAALEARRAELETTRPERRSERIAKIRARYPAAFLRDTETRAELALHGDRLARLERMRRLAEAADRGELVVRIEIALDRENERHQRRMEALEASFEARDK